MIDSGKLIFHWHFHFSTQNLQIYLNWQFHFPLCLFVFVFICFSLSCLKMILKTIIFMFTHVNSKATWLNVLHVLSMFFSVPISFYAEGSHGLTLWHLQLSEALTPEPILAKEEWQKLLHCGFDFLHTKWESNSRLSYYTWKIIDMPWIPSSFPLLSLQLTSGYCVTSIPVPYFIGLEHWHFLLYLSK